MGEKKVYPEQLALVRNWYDSLVEQGVVVVVEPLASSEAAFFTEEEIEQHDQSR